VKDSEPEPSHPAQSPSGAEENRHQTHRRPRPLECPFP